MKKLLTLFGILFLGLFASTFAAGKTYTYNLPQNFSSKVWTTPKLTGVNYMNALNSRKLLDVPATATTAILTTTFDDIGTTKMNYKHNTYTITAGYTSCKVIDNINRKELPVTKSIDLTNLKCYNKKGTVNLLPELKAGKRINIFFAKINGTTKNTTIKIK